MNSYGTSPEEHGRAEVGIGAAQHVYGPASVHLLPCKVHHTGPAPVATYFRPTPPLVKDMQETATAAETIGAEGLAKDMEAGGEESGEPAGGADSCEGTAGQKWEHFEDDRLEQTARFRGRKLM